MTVDFRILLIALLALVVGIALHILAGRWPRRFYSTILISWLVIALSPVLLLFSLFPDSTVDGDILGFQVSGAVAAFLFLWYFGTGRALRTEDIDKCKTEREDLEQQVARLDNKLLQVTSARTTAGRIQVAKPLKACTEHIYKINNARKRRIGILTGDIKSVKNIDVWVNSENTNMQMARFFDLSISAVIRYHGAQRDRFGDVKRDTIAEELSEAMGSKTSVQPATVLQTGPGELATTHGVKRIFHVATVQGEGGAGYQSVRNLGDCVSNVLEEADDTLVQGQKLKSVVFPLLGSGTAQGELSELVDRLFNAAISYCEGKPSGNIERIYFLAYTDVDLETCQEILADTDRVTES